MNNLYFCNHCEVEIIIRVNKPHKNNLLMTEILKPAALESTQSRFKNYRSVKSKLVIVSDLQIEVLNKG